MSMFMQGLCERGY